MLIKENNLDEYFSENYIFCGMRKYLNAAVTWKIQEIKKAYLIDLNKFIEEKKNCYDYLEYGSAFFPSISFKLFYDEISKNIWIFFPYYWV